MTIEEYRSQFKIYRSKLTTAKRQEWERYQQNLLSLDTPPTPREWVAEIKKFFQEDELEGLVGKWQDLRASHGGWGDNLDPSQIEGWGTADLSTRLVLIRLQINLDINTICAYEEWESER